MTSSRIPQIANVIPQDWNSVLRFSRDVQKYMSTLANSEGSWYLTDLYLTSTTASRLLATDASQKMVSTDASSWISGTADQITVADDADGTCTLSTPQNLDRETDFEVGSLTTRNAENEITYFHDDSVFYITYEEAVEIATGMPIGLLLTLTYNIP